MTLGELLYDIRNKYDEVSSQLEAYKDVPEVESFLKRRGVDLKEFERQVRGYDLSTLTGIVLNSLRENGVEYKIYGICSRGEEYFKVTKKVEKAITQYEDDLLREAYEQKVTQEELDFDKEYAIPDELTVEQFEEIFGNENGE